MPGQLCMNSTTEGFDLGEVCYYNVYQNIMNVTEVTDITEEDVQCGFNSGHQAYCDVKKGDPPYMTYLTLAAAFYQQDFNCSVNS